VAGKPAEGLGRLRTLKHTEQRGDWNGGHQTRRTRRARAITQGAGERQYAGIANDQIAGRPHIAEVDTLKARRRLRRAFLLPEHRDAGPKQQMLICCCVTTREEGASSAGLAQFATCLSHAIAFGFVMVMSLVARSERDGLRRNDIGNRTTQLSGEIRTDLCQRRSEQNLRLGQGEREEKAASSREGHNKEKEKWAEKRVRADHRTKA